MAQSGNRFATALQRHPRALLREAFEACRDAGVGSYDRTTLNRWIDGSIPNSGEYVRCMGEKLGDPDLYQAWHESQHSGTRSAAHPDTVVKRFESLTIEERKEVFPEIRKLFLEQFEEVRSRATWRVELRDWPDPETGRPDPDYFELRLMMEWDGQLPANFRAIYSNTTEGLGDAYEDPQCLFREMVPSDDDTFASLLATWPEQVLAYNVIGPANQQISRHVGVSEGDGVFQFDNPQVEQARIRLGLSYPYPRGVRVFFVKFGDYRFEGGAEVTLALSTESASSPGAFTFLPTGRQREFAADMVRPNEMVVTLGLGGTMLSQGDGVVLYWTES